LGARCVSGAISSKAEKNVKRFLAEARNLFTSSFADPV
jgi:hypothetical protein